MDLVLEGLAKRYADTVAVAGVDLTVAEGETLALVGPSGCGKSTLLRLVAGLERPDEGRIRYGSRDVTDQPPQKRGFGMVFQDYALFPHLSVADNVAFGLVELRWEAARRRERVAELLELVGLRGFGARRPDELSGGQQQRVALARALAPYPRVLLLDEPLSNLDLRLRESLKRELRELLAGLDVRSVYVTHDQAEALTVGDRVAVMRAGSIVQVGPGEEVVARPASTWVARFLGYRNVLEAGALQRIDGAPDADAALLRSDVLSLALAGDGSLEARVHGVKRTGLAWELELFVPAWGTTIVWEGFARDLDGHPRKGATLHLRVPHGAWVPLERDPS